MLIDKRKQCNIYINNNAPIFYETQFNTININRIEFIKKINPSSVGVPDGINHEVDYKHIFVECHRVAISSVGFEKGQSLSDYQGVPSRPYRKKKRIKHENQRRLCYLLFGFFVNVIEY